MLTQGFLRYFRSPSGLLHAINPPVQMKQAAIELIKSSISDRALQAGNNIPNFVLPNAVNKSVDIQDLLKSGFVIISFYCGGWCPYCSLQLRAIQQRLSEIKAYGGTLVAISPQTSIIPSLLLKKIN